MRLRCNHRNLTHFLDIFQPMSSMYIYIYIYISDTLEFFYCIYIYIPFLFYFNFRAVDYYFLRNKNNPTAMKRI